MIKYPFETISLKDKYRMAQVLEGETIRDVVGDKNGSAHILFESGCSLEISPHGYMHTSDKEMTKTTISNIMCEMEAVFGGMVRKK